MTAGFAPLRPRLPLRIGNRVVELGERTLIMGIVNCTPDSFYPGERNLEPAGAIRRYEQVVDEGADWVDVGGESTRPGAEPVDAEEEWRRIRPVIDAARRRGHPIPLSVDTTKHEVAARALDQGAAIVNDVSGLAFDARLAELAAHYRAALVLMHMRGDPRTMQKDPRYRDVVQDVRSFLAAAVARARARGVAENQILVDPGIGFGKTLAHNLELLRRLHEFALLRRPLLIGCSRKGFIGALTGAPLEERLEGSLAAHAAAVCAGAHVVRVHDVRAHVRAMRVLDAVRAAHDPARTGGAAETGGFVRKSGPEQTSGG
ncbi:MAG: dihydropteroate synthase [Candidatus Eisenbacteria bacterium]|nr:dihydropteroate synthase [Candidatus Eisenbacteria bacterium]